MINRLLIVAGAAALLLSPAAALAGDQDFTLRNRTGYTINEVYVSAINSDDWEEDVMGRDALGDGESVDISFARNEGTCRWDMKVVYDDKETAEWSNIDLCSTSVIALHYDNGRTWATTE